MKDTLKPVFRKDNMMTGRTYVDDAGQIFSYNDEEFNMIHKKVSDKVLNLLMAYEAYNRDDMNDTMFKEDALITLGSIASDVFELRKEFSIDDELNEDIKKLEFVKDNFEEAYVAESPFGKYVIIKDMRNESEPFYSIVVPVGKEKKKISLSTDNFIDAEILANLHFQKMVQECFE